MLNIVITYYNDYEQGKSETTVLSNIYIDEDVTKKHTGQDCLLGPFF